MHSGFAIAIAWPETLCQKAGAWYDLPMSWLKISRDDFYKVGHSAVILVSDESKSCSYYDFGRYHSPEGFGRVRSSNSDRDLEIKTNVTYSQCGTKIENLHDLLIELNSNPSTHGDGHVAASVTRVDYDLASSYALSLQTKDFLRYGPFITPGTNCSRFVRDVIRAGKPPMAKKVLLKYPPMISPSPLWNVQAVGMGDEVIRLKKPFIEKPSKAPSAKSIPQNSLWLGGTGAGSWFSIVKIDVSSSTSDEQFEVERYSPTGELECSGVFKLDSSQGTSELNIELDMSKLKILYPSNCNGVVFEFEGDVFVLNKLKG